MKLPTSADQELERLRRQIVELEGQLDSDRLQRREQLELAAEVHHSLLPKPIRHDRIDVDLRYQSVDEVGGDYCQVRIPSERFCYITMCDVTGHGIAAALLATRVSSEVRHRILELESPRNIVDRLNRFIVEHFASTGLYLTFFVARVDLQIRELAWSGAGHPPALLIRKKKGTVEQLVSQNLMVGVLADCLQEDPEHNLQLERGDRIVFYTDGVIETEDRDNQMLGIDGLGEFCVQAMSVGLFQTADFILDRVALLERGEASDDKTLIVAEIK